MTQDTSVKKFLHADKDYEAIECDRPNWVCAVRVKETVGRIHKIAMRAFAVRLFLVALSSASASAQDIGCFVNGVCGSGSIVGGNDRLPDEQESSDCSVQQNILSFGSVQDSLNVQVNSLLHFQFCCTDRSPGVPDVLPRGLLGHGVSVGALGQALHVLLNLR